MLRNEYGSIQQHLEPVHISNLLIPVPDDLSILASIVAASQKSMLEKEASYDALKDGINRVRQMIDSIYSK